MIIWINGSFGVGKTTTAKLLQRKLRKAHIYDPEQVGYFLWDNFPSELACQGDFQDMEIWRLINYQVIKHLNDTYDGDIIIPMTLAKRQYYDEIIGQLEQNGIPVRHFILIAPYDVIVERLKNRGEESGSWAEQQVERCLAAYRYDIPGIQVDTDRMEEETVVEYIMCNIRDNLCLEKD